LKFDPQFGKNYNDKLREEHVEKYGEKEPIPDTVSKADAILARTSKLLAEMGKTPALKQVHKRKERKPKERKNEVTSGKGYVYTYDADGKPIPKSRVLMEAKLGRPLQDHEVIVYLDKDRRNCVIENLAIGFKGNSPITLLKCDHCGTVGEISLIQADNMDSPGYQCPPL
jgi:hypothetical protein